MSRPDPSEYAPPYASYVALVPEDPLLAMKTERMKTLALLRDVPEAEALKHHPPYTWSVKDVIGHIIDAERVFGYRALRFARGDSTPLPGFDENPYVVAARFDRIPLGDLSEEYEGLRRSHLYLFGNLPESAWDLKGTASGHEISVRALAAVLVGHERHHTAILRKRLGRA